MSPTDGPFRLVIATDAHDFAVVGLLFREYIDSLGFPLTFQDVDRELAELPTEYGPPTGRAFLAMAGSDPAGAVGVRRFDATAAEIKRMYVRPPFRGLGLGRLLAEAAVRAAGDLGYPRVLLDTRGSMTAALSVYRTLGFQEIAPYRDNPLPDAVFMERTARLTSPES